MSFSYPDPDFSIRCLPEGIEFGVKKAKLAEGSEVFFDMFSCCEQEKEPAHDMEVYESASTFSILLRLLHDPPSVCPKEGGRTELNAVIPLPILPRLFYLADKYAISASITHNLHTHLAKHASTSPLVVYGLATQLSLPDIADEASAFLVSLPLHAYKPEEIKVIPAAEAYHRLLQLQRHRTLKIRELLANTDLFPHMYGACPVHVNSAKAIWEKERGMLVLRTDAGTDVAAEMSAKLESLTSKCSTCKKACQAATDMLNYKISKVPSRISRLPKENP
ncbi:hypothetical protein M0805_008345 [Coniferiporia weirii]|nr:hypothetical protein M0805_008345 [Coniferiporia weirii]